MRFIDAPLYVRQMIVVSFIFTFVLAIIGLFASVRFTRNAAISFAGGNVCIVVSIGIPYNVRK